jgi:hypothetical protein
MQLSGYSGRLANQSRDIKGCKTFNKDRIDKRVNVSFWNGHECRKADVIVLGRDVLDNPSVEGFRDEVERSWMYDGVRGDLNDRMSCWDWRVVLWSGSHCGTWWSCASLFLTLNDFIREHFPFRKVLFQ